MAKQAELGEVMSVDADRDPACTECSLLYDYTCCRACTKPDADTPLTVKVRFFLVGDASRNSMHTQRPLPRCRSTIL